jgi:biotin synthase-related radical SAM superfamily protein
MGSVCPYKHNEIIRNSKNELSRTEKASVFLADANAKTTSDVRRCEAANLARRTCYSYIASGKLPTALSGYKETNRIHEEYQLIRCYVVW